MSECTSVVVTWSGEKPNLCDGEWTLIVNGLNVSDKIPPCQRNSFMYTFGTFRIINENDESHKDVTNGLKEIEWIEENLFWLHEITTDKKLLSEIFLEFQKHDWRHGVCGGCV